MEIGGLSFPSDRKVTFREDSSSCVMNITANVGVSSASRSEEVSHSTSLALRVASLCILFAFFRCFPICFFAIFPGSLLEIFRVSPGQRFCLLSNVVLGSCSFLFLVVDFEKILDRGNRKFGHIGCRQLRLLLCSYRGKLEARVSSPLP